MRLQHALRIGVLAAGTAGFLSGSDAAAQPGQNVIFHARLDEYSSYANVWGYTAPDGREYALLGATTGLSVINLEDPTHPYETGFFSGPTSTWREIATYGHYAYVVTEGGGGLVIVDLADPENPVRLANYNGFGSAHTVRVDEATARCFINGSNLGNGGVRILSLANPAAPVEIGSWETRYAHDCYVKGTRLYVAAIFDGRLDIVNLTTLPPPAAPIASIMNYPSAFTHNAWTTDDGSKVITTDETSGSSVRMWDVSSLPATPQTDAYRAVPTPPIPHNVHVDGNLAYVSHYTLGVKILDVSNPFDMVEVGSFDTYAPNDGDTFDGCWGVFPYFGTHPDLFVLSDIQNGLYVLEFSENLGGVAGQITDAENPGTPIAGATVELLGTLVSTTTGANGGYVLAEEAGDHDLRVSAFGYVTETVPVTIVAGDTVSVNVALDHAPGGAISGVVTDAGSAAPIAGAKVEVLATPLQQTTSGSGEYEFPAVPAGVHSVRASAFGFNSVTAAVNVTPGSSPTLDFPLPQAPVSTTFESGTAGWVVTGINGTNIGRWALGDPEPTNGGTIQTGDDHTPSPGVNAWITGLAAGAGIGGNDVDGGATILTSPIFNTLGMTAPRVSYWRWYVTGATTNPTTDFWTVELSTNGGGSWSPIENTDIANPSWVNIDAALGPPSGLTQFRFTARDTGAGSITEAGLDDFMIYDELVQFGTSAPSPIAGAVLDLGRPYPSPFRRGQATSLSLTIPASGAVTVRVYDVAGRRVATILEEALSAGPHRLVWDGRSDSGLTAPAGMYFIRATTPDRDLSRRVLLLR